VIPWLQSRSRHPTEIENWKLNDCGAQQAAPVKQQNMSEALHVQPHTGVSHGYHDEHHDHHKETFITKYIFSQDHKMIARQFLITGMVWAVIGGLFSVLFRLQLGYPDLNFPILETFFGHWARGGKIQPEFYYALVTIHGTVMVFFVLTAGLSGTFANLLIPLQIGARDMALTL
jgi:cytochrome c oxidase subunit 1